MHRSARPMQTVPEEAKKQEERSPLLLLSRRIREEQGAEGLKAFLIAMEPFAAPYELKNIASRFGMEHTPSSPARGFSAANTPPNTFGAINPNQNHGFNTNNNTNTNSNPNPGMGFDPNMLRMMQMMNGAGNGGNGGMGGNMVQMMQLMRLLPMLQSMGKGGADISQIMKMMNM